jgi:GDPmannose 4,6-dehydratase
MASSKGDAPTEKRVLVTGVTGQDGHYLSKLLLAEGCTVYGLVRRSSRDTELNGVPDGVLPILGDVADPSIVSTLTMVQPAEIYHLAAMSHVGDSFDMPHHAMVVNAGGTANMLEVARATGSRFYQASTSELFGNTPPPQSEDSAMSPASPYACAKLAAYHLVRTYREAYHLHASNGILFNHESPLRGADFVTQRVAQGVAAITRGEQKELVLGNLSAKRDWGHAEDFCRGMIAMVRKPRPGDYVLATGKSRTVAELCETAFWLVGIDDWFNYVVSDPGAKRPLDVQHLRGDAQKARTHLGWSTTWTFEKMIEEMLHAAGAVFSSGVDLRARGKGGPAQSYREWSLYDGGYHSGV